MAMDQNRTAAHDDQFFVGMSHVSSLSGRNAKTASKKLRLVINPSCLYKSFCRGDDEPTTPTMLQDGPAGHLARPPPPLCLTLISSTSNRQRTIPPRSGSYETCSHQANSTLDKSQKGRGSIARITTHLISVSATMTMIRISG